MNYKVLAGILLATGTVLAVANILASRPSDSGTNPIIPIIIAKQQCYGNLTVRLHNGHLLSSVSYGFYVVYGDPKDPAFAVTPRVEYGNLAPGENKDFWFRSIPCGDGYRIGVSWDGGQWVYKIAELERGKTTPLYIPVP